MIKVRIAGMVEFEYHRAVILLDEAGQRALSIEVWGSANWDIKASLREWHFFLPETFEFLAEALEASGATLEEACITEFAGDIMCAKARLRSGETTHELDIRPGDALALALRTGSPIYVAEAVLEQAGVPVTTEPGQTLDDAELQRIVEEDERRHRLSLDRVVEGVYISGARRRPHDATLRAANIAGVLKLYDNAVSWPDDIVVFDNHLDDGKFAPWEKVQRGVQFIREQRAAGENVLVACWEGVSRSSTFVLAYLVDGLGYDLHDAWKLLKAQHPKAWPAQEMWESLLEHYKLPYSMKDIRGWLDGKA